MSAHTTQSTENLKVALCLEHHHFQINTINYCFLILHKQVAKFLRNKAIQDLGDVQVYEVESGTTKIRLFSKTPYSQPSSRKHVTVHACLVTWLCLKYIVNVAV